MNGGITLSQEVIQCPNTQLEKMNTYYRANHVSPTPQGALFRAKTSNCVITAYRSGKVLFQGADPELEVAKWTNLNDSTEANKQTIKRTTEQQVPNHFLTGNHSGSDEAGTGDYFGPITVACAYIKQEQIPLLKEIGIQDSKKMTDPKIKALAKQIAQLNIPYSLLILHNEKYNHLQQNGWTQGKMKTMLHHHTYLNLMKKIDATQSNGNLIDQFCKPEIYRKHLRTEGETLPEKTYFMTKAESYSIAVATSSIIARTAFLTEMDKLSAKMGVELPKGASQKVDRVIAEIIKRYGRNDLFKCAKVHFANTQKANAYL